MRIVSGTPRPLIYSRTVLKQHLRITLQLVIHILYLHSEFTIKKLDILHMQIPLHVCFGYTSMAKRWIRRDYLSVSQQLIKWLLHTPLEVFIISVSTTSQSYLMY